MKKTTNNIGIIAVVTVVLCAIGIWIYNHKNGDSFAEDWQKLQQLAEAEADTYELNLKDAEGVRTLLDTENKRRLLQLIVSEAEKGEEREIPDVPALGVELQEKASGFQATLWIYDFGEDTDIGLFQTKHGDYIVKNCGEIFNYLTELGCVTER